MIKIGFVQSNPFFGKVNENNKRIEAFVSSTKADLLVLTELANTGYNFENKQELRQLAEKIPEGKTTKRWIQISRENNVYLVGGLAEISNSKELYNSSVLIGPKGFIGKYRKMHLFYNEKNLFKKGNLGFNIFDTEIGKIGLLICFDYMFPEATRELSLKGADVVCYPMNLKSPPTRIMTAVRTRALENGIYTIAVNRVGKERGKTYRGGSEIVGPRMEILAKAGDKEEVKVVEVDIEKARDKWYTELNHLLKDRRTKFYKN